MEQLFFNIENGLISLSQVSGTVNGQKLSGEVTVDATGESPVFEGNVFLHQVDLTALLPGEGISGILDGNVNFSGTTDDPSVSGALTGKAAFL